jgi:glycosyltransferase involved in cell wall biosynthesis
LGRINWKKGLDRLIRAWQQVPDLTLIIAGNDDEGYQKDLQALVHGIDIANRVHFIGPVSDENKWAVYERAEMFVLSSYSENFGNVVAEAMAMGCPVVVTPEVGLAQFVAEARAGIVTDGDPMSLSAAVQKLHGDAPLRKSMGVAGRLAVEKSLSWGGIALQLEAVYDDIIASSGTDVEARLHLATRR